MTDQEQIIELAKLDDPNQDWEVFTNIDDKQCVGYCYPERAGWTLAKDYLNSRDAIVPLVIKCLDNGIASLEVFIESIEQISGMHIHSAPGEWYMSLLRLTPHQLCKTLLRATGKRKE